MFKTSIKYTFPVLSGWLKIFSIVTGGQAENDRVTVEDDTRCRGRASLSAGVQDVHSMLEYTVCWSTGRALLVVKHDQGHGLV